VARFLAIRISLTLITLLVVSIAIFAILEILPGDVAQMLLKQDATEARLELLREELGLNHPAHVRYLNWVGNAIQGDFGDSYYIKRPIAEILPRRIFHSIVLALFALLFGIPVAIMSGIWAGIRPDSLLDRLVSTISLIGISLPEFVTGVLLMFFLASTLHLLPPSSNMMEGETPLSRPQILIMPAITLTGVLFAYIMRMTRANVIEVMQSQYVRTATLKGIPLRRVILRHVLPNSMLPTITIIAQNFGWMLGGLIIVENVFAYPGLGLMLLGAMRHQDVPLLEAIALLISLTYVLSNLLADLIYLVIDPRIRLS
jgi:peptide/nickel transport system permease protein